MSDDALLFQLRHSANNCRQMLAAIERKLNRALACLQNDEVEECRELLEVLSQALPEAVAIITTDNDNETETDCPGEAAG